MRGLTWACLADASKVRRTGIEGEREGEETGRAFFSPQCVTWASSCRSEEGGGGGDSGRGLRGDDRNNGVLLEEQCWESVAWKRSSHKKGSMRLCVSRRECLVGVCVCCVCVSVRICIARGEGGWRGRRVSRCGRVWWEETSALAAEWNEWRHRTSESSLSLSSPSPRLASVCVEAKGLARSVVRRSSLPSRGSSSTRAVGGGEWLMRSDTAGDAGERKGGVVRLQVCVGRCEGELLAHVVVLSGDVRPFSLCTTTSPFRARRRLSFASLPPSSQFEAEVMNDGAVRIGWAAATSSFELGTDEFSFGYGFTGKKSWNR